MLDIKDIRNNYEFVKERLSVRGKEYPLEELKTLDEKRREIIGVVEEKKAYQNEISKKIPMMKKEGKDTEEIFKEMKELSNEIKSFDEELQGIDEKNQRSNFGNSKPSSRKRSERKR